MKIGDPILKTINTLADRTCWNCKNCLDLQLTELEIEDFICNRTEEFLELNKDLTCEWWESSE